MLFCIILLTLVGVSLSESTRTEYVKTTGNCKKISSIREGNKYANVENTEFKDRNCRERCDKDSSCTGYLLPRIKQHRSHNWCTTYTSVELTGNGREDYDCWMKERENVYDASFDDYEEKNDEEEADTYWDDQYDDERQEDDEGEEDNEKPYCVQIIPGDEITRDTGLNILINTVNSINDVSYYETIKEFRKTETKEGSTESMGKCFRYLDTISVRPTNEGWKGKIIVTYFGVRQELSCRTACEGYFENGKIVAYKNEERTDQDSLINESICRNGKWCAFRVEDAADDSVDDYYDSMTDDGY